MSGSGSGMSAVVAIVAVIAIAIVAYVAVMMFQNQDTGGGINVDLDPPGSVMEGGQ